MEQIMSNAQVADLCKLATENGATLTLHGDRVVQFAGISDDLAVTFRAGHTCLLRPFNPEYTSLLRQVYWFANGVEA